MLRTIYYPINQTLKVTAVNSFRSKSKLVFPEIIKKTENVSDEPNQPLNKFITVLSRLIDKE